MSTNSKTFHPEAGTFIPEEDALKLREEYCKREREKHHHDDFTRAYFFGKDKLDEVLNYDNGKDKIVGMRIYYGYDSNGDGIDDKKMVIYPVNEDGKDVIMHPQKPHAATRSAAASTEESESSADSATTTSGGKALDGGLPCPTYCP